MCGIAGIVMRDGRDLDEARLDNLARAMAHRGPDGAGTFVAGPIGLLSTRLAIIELATGDQPLFEPEGAVLVANGEIYNDPELRAALAGAPYRTGSDCESPLQLYRRRGVDFAADLRGMYAIALFDPSTRQVVLARDPFGIKQLYYVETPEFFAFASEAQALIAAGLAGRTLRATARAELMQLKFTTGRETIFSDIQRVLPGERLVLSAGVVVERRANVPALAPAPGGAAEAFARRLAGDNGPPRAVSYAAEAGQFQQAGYSVVICGPGSIDQAHQPDEYVEIAQMERGAAFMARLLAALVEEP